MAAAGVGKVGAAARHARLHERDAGLGDVPYLASGGGGRGDSTVTSKGKGKLSDQEWRLASNMDRLSDRY